MNKQTTHATSRPNITDKNSKGGGGLKPVYDIPHAVSKG